MDFLNYIKDLIVQHKKAVLISVVAIVALTIIVLLSTVFRPIITNTGTVYLNIAPYDAMITINSKEYVSGEHFMEAGEYTLEAQKDEFETQTTDFVVEVGKDTIVTLALRPLDINNTWYLDHPEDGMIYTQYADQRADIEAANFLEKFPITRYVPYTETSDNPLQNNRFKIDTIYRYEDDSLSLKVKLNTCSDYSAEIYKQAALDWLNSKNVDLSPYEITFSTFCD